MIALQWSDTRVGAWVALLVAASLLLSRTFACAMPFAAFATLGR